MTPDPVNLADAGNPITLRRESDNETRTFFASSFSTRAANIAELVEWAKGTRVFAVGVGNLTQEDSTKQPEVKL